MSRARDVSDLDELQTQATRHRMPRAGVESGSLQHLRQLGDVRGYPPRLVAGGEVCRRTTER